MSGREEEVPVWLLDVDGVLNAVTRYPDCEVWPRESWVRTEAEASGRVWPLWVATPVLEFLTEMHESGKVEVRWHTTWREDAARSLAPTLGLPDFPMQEAAEFDAPAPTGYGGVKRGSTWWKLPAAERVVRDEGRRLVWTDDDIALERARYGLGKAFDSEDILLVAPDVRTGLTPQHLEAVRDFAG